jgi:hypothetical protein
MTTINNGRFAEQAATIKKLNQRKGFNKTIEIGRVLWQIKPLFANQAQYLDWLKSNLPFGQSIANRYMRCFEQRDKLLTTLDAKASVADAFRVAGIATGHHKPTTALGGPKQ